MNEIKTKIYTKSNIPMSDKIFRRLGQYIQSEYGIMMPPAKKIMLQGRLNKRLRRLGMDSFEEYCEFTLSPAGANEIIHMVDAVSTNKTDFFREPAHFDYLVKTVLPTLIHERETGLRRKFAVWSAGCSTGEEPYTLAMVLREFAENNHGFRFSILGTDISTQVLETARRAIYKQERAAPIPVMLKTKYLLKSKDKRQELIRIAPELRTLVQFRRLNFMDHDFGMQQSMDIIFCRNVIIYFNRNTQEKLINKFYRNLNQGGYIFMGHSETLSGLSVPLVSVAPTVYRKV